MAGEVVLGSSVGLSGIQAEVVEFGGEVFHVDGVGEATGWPRLFQPGGTRIRGSLHHSIGKASPGFFERGASNLATEYDEQIRVPHVLKNMGHPVRNSAEDPDCS